MAVARRKLRTGRVIKDKSDKTVLVVVQWQQRHLLYKKSIRRTTKYYVHDQENRCKVGDLVRIEETRPISRLKRWRVMEIIERREVAEIKPSELDEGLLSEEQETQAQREAENDGEGTPEPEQEGEET
jgi:small subunit ribosomal protein S17